MRTFRVIVILIVILSLGVLFRFYGLNWDSNQHLHPDERFLTLVTLDTHWPKTFAQYLTPNLSPLNPYNAGHSFFVYGTFPLTLVKFLSSVITLHSNPYHNITLVGRVASAFFDLGTLIVVFLIGRKVFGQRVGLVASFVYALMVLPIQLSHFFAVDTFLVFFTVLSFYFILFSVPKKLCWPMIVLSGCSFGLGMGSKVSALIMLPVLLIGLAFSGMKKSTLVLTFSALGMFLLSALVAFRIADPHAFSSQSVLDLQFNHQFIDNLKQLRQFNAPETRFPPSIQWISTTPYLFPLKNMLLWGLGIPLGIITFVGVFYYLLVVVVQLRSYSKKNKFSFTTIPVQQLFQLLILIYISIVFVYQGGQFSKAMRYFYPIYPFLSLVAAFFITQIIIRVMSRRYFVQLVVSLVIVFYPFSFLSIYSRPHSRVVASQWIYEHIPVNSIISCEYWDDCLPLSLGSNFPSLYSTEVLHLYDPDTPQKWGFISQQLEKLDYFILSSNRLSGSISRVPSLYPQTSTFYKDLFSGALGFEQVAEFTSRPTIPFLDIELADDGADESFTVYDHPKVMIFRKKY